MYALQLCAFTISSYKCFSACLNKHHMNLMQVRVCDCTYLGCVSAEQICVNVFQNMVFGCLFDQGNYFWMTTGERNGISWGDDEKTEPESVCERTDDLADWGKCAITKGQGSWPKIHEPWPLPFQHNWERHVDLL